ncbi:hypothetical protein ES705_24375 [subsurface metagenome]
MTDEKMEQFEKNLRGQTMRELQDLSEHILDVLVKNAKTDTLVYGLLLSLLDDSKRGITRKTLKKEIVEAIKIAHLQFGYLFFPDDEQPEGGDK